MSARSGSNSDPTVCVNERVHTHSAPPPLHSDDLATAAQDFSRQWVAALPSGSQSWLRDQAKESAEVAAELLGAGWTLAELLTDLSAADRLPREWPREYAARHGPEALKAARRSAKEAEERERRATTLDQERKEIARRVSLNAQFEALPPDQMAALTDQVLKSRPDLAKRPGIVRVLAFDLFAEQLAGDGVAGDQAELPEVPELRAQAQ